MGFMPGVPVHIQIVLQARWRTEFLGQSKIALSRRNKRSATSVIHSESTPGKRIHEQNQNSVRKTA